MARALRIEYAGACYHISNQVSTQNRSLFRTTDDRKFFLGLLGSAAKIYRIKIYAYALCDKEYHLMIVTPRANISLAMRHINGLYTQHYNRAYRKTGPLFRGRFQSILIDIDNYFLDIIKWIHRISQNTSKKTGWKNSLASSRYYVFNIDKQPEWIYLHEALIMLCPEYGDNISSAYEAYERKPINETVENFYKNRKKGFLLGDENFIDQLKRRYKDPVKLEAALWASKKDRISIEASVILNKLKKYYGITNKELYFSKKGKPNEYRKAAVYLLRLQGYTLIKIMNIMKFNTYVAVSYIYSTFSGELNTNPSLAREFRALNDFVNQA